MARGARNYSLLIDKVPDSVLAAACFLYPPRCNPTYFPRSALVPTPILTFLNVTLTGVVKDRRWFSSKHEFGRGSPGAALLREQGWVRPMAAQEL